jgi:prepilin-type N-terminal cleavage/methylation domain-containing protein
MSRPAFHRPSRRAASIGFTLAELLVALSLLAIITGMAWSFYLFVHKQVVTREGKAFEFDNAYVLLESVAKNVRQSRATLVLDESKWVFVTPRGDTASYVFSDGELRFGTLALTLGGRAPAGFSFTCFGNDTLLDLDGDRTVSFNELDLNGDGRIEGPETQNVKVIRAELGAKEGMEETLAIVETVKNNLSYDEAGYQTYFKE